MVTQVPGAWTQQDKNKYAVMDAEEPESRVGERGTERSYEEPKGSLGLNTLQSGDCGTESELYGAHFLSAYPACMQQDRWGERGGGGGGGGEEASPSSMLECSIYLDDQHLPVAPLTHRPCPFIPVAGSATVITTADSSAANPTTSSCMTDTCSPFSPICGSTDSDWDTLRSTSIGCDRDPVTAAAHLHLLGESLSLIGNHLQETDKMVSMSGTLSLLLDSLLCALAPIVCLTAQIPELRSCTQHTLASTLENIAYVMPGL